RLATGGDIRPATSGDFHLAIDRWSRQVKLLKVRNTGDTVARRCRVQIEATEAPLPSVALPLMLTWASGAEEQDIPPGQLAKVRLYWDEVRTATRTVTDFPPGLAVHSVPFTVRALAEGFAPIRQRFRLQEMSEEAAHPEVRGRALLAP